MRSRAAGGSRLSARMVERAYELRINYNTIVSLVSVLARPFSARNEFDEWQRTQLAVAGSRTSRAAPRVRVHPWDGPYDGGPSWVP